MGIPSIIIAPMSTGLATEVDPSSKEASVKTTTSTSTTTSPSRSPGAMDTEMDSAKGSEKSVQAEAHTDMLPGEDPSNSKTELAEAASHALPATSVDAIADVNEAADIEMEEADAVDLDGQSTVDDAGVELTPDHENNPLATGNGSEQEEVMPDDSRESPDESDFYEPPEATHSPFHETSSGSDQASINASGLTNQSTAEAETQGDDDTYALLEPTTVVATGKSPPKEYFTPYDSPLKQFRAYRYHRNYLKDVPGGFRSLTYSHNIDADKPLCKFETSGGGGGVGGVCNDAGCQDQHFRDMKLNDDMVLVHLGSVNEGHNSEEKGQYREGLKQIIQNMRNQKVKDFSTVASQITGYRSRFLKDESRVLILDLQNQQRKSPGTQAGGT
ncbi:hypothetical protein GP486_008353 [Trichoglossum hirsutum]|uniref:Putative zinc-finger domain-containing protein n=1 Tax=Trichoglossum hirsutum TaxID=265104 RepID=A0A9P8L756_9PEZI|nr:hypothetical protein GP486_008353 [Trichoglossum hirsutum]